MTTPTLAVIPIVQRTDPAVAASLARRFAVGVGFSETEAAQIAIMASELASNALLHGGGGTVLLRFDRPAGVLMVEAEDAGEAPVDVDALLGGGLMHDPLDERGRPRPGLGRGIDAVRRLADELQAENRAPRGLWVRATRRLRR